MYVQSTGTYIWSTRRCQTICSAIVPPTTNNRNIDIDTKYTAISNCIFQANQK